MRKIQKPYLNLYLIFILLLFYFPSQSQKNIESKIDSLQKLLTHTKADSNKVNILIQIAQIQRYTNPENSLNYSKQALLLSKEHKLPLKEAEILNMIGTLFRNMTQYDSAMIYHLSSIEIYEKLKISRGIAINFANIANIYNIQKQWDKSNDYYQKALKELEQAKDWRSIGIIYINIGSTYYQKRNWVKAKEMHEKALSYIEKSKDEESKILAYANLSSIFFELNNDAQAIAYAQKTLISPNKTNGIVASVTMAKVFLKRKDHKAAEKYALKALQYAQDTKDLEKQIEVSTTLIDIYRYKNDLQAQIKIWEKINKLKDSLHQINLNAHNQSLEKRLENLRFKNQERVANEKQSKQEQIISRQRLYLVLFASMILIISFLGVIGYQKNKALKKAYEEIQQKNRQLNEQKEEIKLLNNNLENIVNVRTQQLQERNQQLEQYAFYNSHKLRAPIANLLGLYNIYLQENSAEEKEKILAYIDQSVKKLDDLVREIQRIVETDEHLSKAKSC